MSISLPIALRGAGSPSSLFTLNDFTYSGFFSPPVSSSDPAFNLGFSNAQLTGRRYTDGFGTNTLRLLMGNWSDTGGNPGPQLIEFNYPGVGTSKVDGIAGMPTATYYRGWYSIINRTNSQLTVDAQGIVCRGLGYIGNLYDRLNGTELVLGYTGPYTVVSGDPSLLSIQLNDDGTAETFGPWCNTFGGPFLAGGAHRVPSSVQTATSCGSLGITCAANGFINASPWGMNWSTFDMPSLNTPADAPHLNPSSPAITPRAGSLYNYTNPMPQTYPNCYWNAGSVGFGGGCPTTNWTPGNFWGGAASSTDLTGPKAPDGEVLGGLTDWFQSGLMFETGGLRGLLMVGQLAQFVSGWAYSDTSGKNKFWYGSNRSCQSPVDNGGPFGTSTGPHTETLLRYMWIADPADMILGLNGSVPINGAGAAMPVSAFSADQFAGGEFGPGLAFTRGTDSTYPAVLTTGSGFRNLAQFYFDNVSGLLFLSQQAGYTHGGNPTPLIHVFQCPV